MASERSGESDRAWARYSDGHLNLFMEEQWVPEDQLSIVEKEFFSFLIAKIPPGGYKIDQKCLLGARYKIQDFCRETYTAY